MKRSYCTDGLPLSSKETIEKGFKLYKGKPCKYGHIAPRYANNGTCQQCCHIKNDKQDKTKKAEYVRQWRLKNPNYIKDYYDKNADTLRAKALAYQKAKPEKARASSAKRRAIKLNATPQWADISKIDEIYQSAIDNGHVDHIFPLSSKYGCGLHVHWNLAVISRKENEAKSNKLIPEICIDYSAPGWRVD